MPNTRSKKPPHLPVKKKRSNGNATAEQISSPSKNLRSTINKSVQHALDNESTSSSNSQLGKEHSKNASLGQYTSPTKNQTLTMKESSIQHSLSKQNTSSSKNLDLPSLNEPVMSPSKNQQSPKMREPNISSSDVQDTSPVLRNKPKQDSGYVQNISPKRKKLCSPTKRKTKQKPSNKQNTPSPRNLRSPLKRKLNKHTSDDQESLLPSKKSCVRTTIVQEEDQSNKLLSTNDLSQSATINNLETETDVNPKTIQVSKNANQPTQIPNIAKLNTLPINLTNIPKLRMTPSTPETAKTNKNQITPAKTVDIDKLLTPNPQILQSSPNFSQHLSKKVPRLSPLKKEKIKANSKRSPKKIKSKTPSPSKRMLQRKSNERCKFRIEGKKVSNDELSDRKRCSVKRIKKKDDEEQSSATSKTDYTYIAEGLKEDCQNLVEKCLQVSKLNFQKFCEIWKEMNFPCIYYGRQSGAEIAEFSEEAIHIAKAHMLAKNVGFEENVAGLFLVYAFLNNQPYKDFAALRLIPSDVPAVLQLESEARKQRRNDILYILGSVLIKGPCQYHVLPREVAFDLPYRKYYDGTIQVSGRAVEGVLTKTAECVHQFKEATLLDQRYAAIRKKLNERNGGLGFNLNLSTQPAAELFSMYRQHVPGGLAVDPNLEAILKKSQLETPPPAEEENRQDLLRSIKHRAMTNVVDPMKHLQGLEDRQHDTSISSTSSETEKVSPRKSSPRIKGKGQGKGKSKSKGRYSAQILQGLFTQEVEKELPPAPSQKEMPTIDMTDDLVTETPEIITAPNIAPSLDIIDDEPLDEPDDLVTVTLETINLPDIAPSLAIDDKEPPNKRAKRNVDHSNEDERTDDNPVQKSAENLAEPAKNVKTRKKRKSRNYPNSDFDKIDTLELPDKVQDSNDKSENLDVTEDATNKSKRIEIKDVQIIKPANYSNANEVVASEKEIDIQFDSIPVVIDATIKNIEVDIIDNFSKENTTEIEDKNNEDVISNQESLAKPKADINDSSTKLDKDKPVTSNKGVKTRIRRKKRKESSKAKGKRVQVVNDSSSDDNDSATNSNQSSEPSAEKNESVQGRRHLKRCRVKSTLKKMGLLDVADFEPDDSAN